MTPLPRKAGGEESIRLVGPNGLNCAVVFMSLFQERIMVDVSRSPWASAGAFLNFAGPTLASNARVVFITSKPPSGYGAGGRQRQSLA